MFLPQQTAQTLRKNALLMTTQWGSQAWIIPGVSSASTFGLPDVMRGEEVQLMGLNTFHPADEVYAILPGTHSKHAKLSHGEITHFSTLMTGELFSLLSQHSLLGPGTTGTAGRQYRFCERRIDRPSEHPFQPPDFLCSYPSFEQ